MKYKTFVLLRGIIIVAIIALGIYMVYKWTMPNGQESTAQNDTTPKTEPIKTDNGSTANTNGVGNDVADAGSTGDYKLSTEPNYTKAQEEIMAQQKNLPMSEGKPDDNNGGLKLFKKFPHYQLDLRCDKAKGFDYWNRVKVDWDFDKKWDEKWDFRKNGSIKRQCSTKDDDTYDVVLETVDGKWAPAAK